MSESGSVHSAPGPASGAVSSASPDEWLHPILPSPVSLSFNSSAFVLCTVLLQSPAPSFAVAELRLAVLPPPLSLPFSLSYSNTAAVHSSAQPISSNKSQPAVAVSWPEPEAFTVHATYIIFPIFILQYSLTIYASPLKLQLSWKQDNCARAPTYIKQIVAFSRKLYQKCCIFACANSAYCGRDWKFAHKAPCCELWSGEREPIK